jgi:carbamoyltransferase
MIKGLKDYLNEKVKSRENFRPYGGSCLKEKASIYFEVDDNFQSPFMSFAPKIRQKYRNSLRSIMHVDGTSRIQTLVKSQDSMFYDLIKKFGDITGVYCLLNTSLNVMGEPIVETIQDAKRFLEKTPVDALVVGPYYIRKSSLKSAKKRFLKSCF